MIHVDLRSKPLINMFQLHIPDFFIITPLSVNTPRRGDIR